MARLRMTHTVVIERPRPTPVESTIEPKPSRPSISTSRVNEGTPPQPDRPEATGPQSDAPATQSSRAPLVPSPMLPRPQTSRKKETRRFHPQSQTPENPPNNASQPTRTNPVKPGYYVDSPTVEAPDIRSEGPPGKPPIHRSYQRVDIISLIGRQYPKTRRSSLRPLCASAALRETCPFGKSNSSGSHL